MEPEEMHEMHEDINGEMISSQSSTTLDDQKHDQSALPQSEHQQTGVLPTTANDVKQQPSQTSPKAVGKLSQKAPSQKVSSTSKRGSSQQVPGKADAKLALLYWVRTQLEAYIVSSIIPTVGDFSKSWRNGVAFCLLIHHHDPELIPNLMSEYLQLDLNDKANWRTLLTLAFDTAAVHMNIPKYLDPEDLTDVDYPDEPSVMMYVSEFYKVMSRPKRQPSLPKSATFKWEAKQEPPVQPDAIEEDKPISNESSVLISLSAAEMSPPPTPTPTQQRKVLNRLSSLGDSDKARVKLSIANQLQQQLTGQIPRGIDSNLDQFLTIHETLLSFIKLHRGTISDIPTSLSMADAKKIVDYINLLVDIESQCNAQAGQVAKAVDIKTNLEKQWKDGNNQVSINLTMEQRKRILDMASNLEEEWRGFNRLMQTTKEHLLEQNLHIANIQVQVDDFEHQCSSIISAIASKQQQVDEACPTIEEDGQLHKMHPLEATDDHAEQYSIEIDRLELTLDAFTEVQWQPFLKAIDHTSADVQLAIHERLDECHEQYNRIWQSFHSEQGKSKEFHRGITFVTVSNAIGSELDEVQSRMDNAKSSTTEDGIQDLEGRVSIVHDMLSNFRDRFSDLVGDSLENDDVEDNEPQPLSDYYERFKTVFEDLESKYERVRDWVDQVRVWFVEAERIRKWIEVRIGIIESEDESRLEALGPDVLISHEEVLKLHQAHEKLEREVERFNQDDMTRLRAHVKALTGSDRETKLSPADTTTIEITLTTLNILDRLLHMLRQRRALLQELLLRVEWEEKFEHAVVWVMDMDKRVDVFLFGNARWAIREEHIETDAEGQPSKTVMEQVIAILLDVEQSVADFDQGFYAETLDAYQDLDDVVSEDMPEYLSTRQTGFEGTFEDLSKRVAFTRQAVEQHLAVMDLMTQFQHVKEEGERLRRDLSVAERTAKADDTDNQFSERTADFQEHSVHLVTNVAPRIPYPVTPQYETAVGARDHQENDVVNHEIKSVIAAQGMQLALIAEGIDQKLASYRHVLELQKRCKQLCDEMARMTVWMDEKVDVLNQSKIDLAFSGPLSFDEDELLRLEKEKDGIQTRLRILEEGELSELFDNVRQLEVDVDASSSVAVDRSAVICSVEALGDQHELLRKTLDHHTECLDITRKRYSWETQVNRCQQWIAATARKLCEFADKKAQCHPTLDALPSFNDDDEISQVFQPFQNRLSEFQERQLAVALSSFENLLETYSDFLPNSDSIPTHVTENQKQLLLNYHSLEDLYTYVSQLLSQRSIYTEYVLRSMEVQREGDKLRDAISKSSRRIMEDSTVVFDERISAFQNEIEKGQTECIDKLPMPSLSVALNQAWSSDAEGKPDTQSSNQVVQAMNKKQQELETLAATIETLNVGYTRAVACKEGIARYDNELEDLQGWILSRNKTLVSARIKVTSEAIGDLTDDYIVKKKTELHQAEEESHHFEQERLRVVHDKLAEFVHHVLGQSEFKNLDVSKVANALDKTIASFRQLQDELVYQRELIVTGEERAKYETHVAALSKLLQTIGKRLGVLVVTRDALLARDELDEEHLGQFYNELIDVEDEIQNAAKEMLVTCQSHYDVFVDKLTKLNPPLNEPEHLRLKLQRLQRSISQTDETLTTRLKEHSLLERRLELDTAIHASLQQLKIMKDKTFKFIDDKARWHSSTETATGDDKDSLMDEYEDLYAEFEVYKQSTVEPLCSQYTTYESDTTFHGSQFINHIEKKVEQLKNMASATEGSLLFAKSIVTQNLDIQAFIAQANSLESTAISIRNALTSRGNVEETQTIVAKFVQDVARVLDQVSTKVQFPSRPNDEDVSEQTQQRDQSAQSVIKETINARNTRLQELSSSLQSLLESTERLSRRMSTIQSYRVQADSAKQWIESRMQSLQTITSKSQDTTSAQDLRDYLKQAESVDAMVNAYQHVYISIKSESQVCLKVLEEETDGSDSVQDTQNIQDIQEDLDDLWRNLQDKSQATLLHLHSSYQSKECLQSANNLLIHLRELLETTLNVDPSTIVDESLDEWQTEVSRLEQRDLKDIQSMISSGAKDFLTSDLSKIQDVVDNSEEVVAQIRKQLTVLYDQANINGLRKNYLSNAMPLQEQCNDIMETLSKLMEANMILSPTDDKQRISTHADVVSQYQSITNNISDQKDPFEDVRSLFAFVIAQEHLDDVKSVQNTLDESWALISAKSSAMSTLVRHIKQLCDSYQVVDGVHLNLQARNEELQVVLAADKAPAEESLSALLQKMLDDKRILGDVEELAISLAQLKIDDIPSMQQNADTFHKHVTSFVALLNEQIQSTEQAQDNIAASATMNQFHADVSDFVKKQEASCNTLQACFGKHHMVGSVDTLEVLLTDINMAIAAFEDNLVQAQDTAENLRHRKKSILRRWPQASLEEATQSLDATMRKLEETLLLAKTVQGILGRLFEYEKDAASITEQLSSWKLAVTQNVIGASQSVAKDGTSHVDELRYKLENFERTAIQSFETSCKKICIHCDKSSSEETALFSEAKAVTVSKHKAILKDWNNLKAFLGHAQQNAEDSKLNSLAAEKITELMRYVSDTTRHIQSLKLSEPPVTVDVKEFEAIQKDLKETLAKKTQDLDDLFAQRFAEDERVAELRSKVESQVSDLTHLIEERKQHTEMAEKLKGHMLLIDQLDSDIGHIAISVDKLAPQHARLIENQLIKSDLQSMLQSLYQIRDKRGKTTESQLEVAKKSADDIMNDWKADKRLAKVIDKWHNVQRLMHVRGQELEICIQRLDHEFYTKLAAAKTNPPVRSRRPSITPSNSSQTRSQMSIHRNSSKISLQSYSSTESIRRYRSKSPGPSHYNNNNNNSLVKPHPRYEYLSDPNSDLDTEVGRIINASPYPLKVKRVPGEVGKYWFGEDNRRLVYCRILPSKLVMVRVGGGWVELAQFLAGSFHFSWTKFLFTFIVLTFPHQTMASRKEPLRA
jgi:Calponin homology (CH) domain/Growth-Arrest-Specific Protein 2 Domain